MGRMALDALESFEEDDELQRAASDPASCVCSGSTLRINEIKYWCLSLYNGFFILNYAV